MPAPTIKPLKDGMEMPDLPEMPEKAGNSSISSISGWIDRRLQERTRIEIRGLKIETIGQFKMVAGMLDLKHSELLELLLANYFITNPIIEDKTTGQQIKFNVSGGEPEKKPVRSTIKCWNCHESNDKNADYCVSCQKDLRKFHQGW